MVCSSLVCSLLATLSAVRGCTWWREDRWAGCALRLTLGFDFADEHGGCDGTDRNAAGFSAADAVEDVLMIVRGEDAVERGLRRAYNAGAADEFVGSAVDVDAVDDEWNDLERLGRA